MSIEQSKQILEEFKSDPRNEQTQNSKSRATNSISLKDLILAGEVDKIILYARKINPKNIDNTILNNIVIKEEGNSGQGMDLLMIVLLKLRRKDINESDYNYYQEFAIGLIHRKRNFNMICESHGCFLGYTIPFLALLTGDKRIIDAIFAAVRDGRIDEDILTMRMKIKGSAVNKKAILINLLYKYLKVSPSSRIASIYKKFALYLIRNIKEIDERYDGEIEEGLTSLYLSIESKDYELIRAMLVAFKK